MSLIKGIPIILYEKTQSSVDGFGHPVYTETATTVNNVLVGSPSESDIVASTDLVGKECDYVLAIPKDDTHDWEDVKVEFFGKTFQTTGAVIQGIEDMIPLDWNKKIKVVRYE